MRSSFLRISTVVPLLASTLLAGCGTLDVPRADNYPATGQKKARAVHHWDVLAGDVAARVAEKLGIRHVPALVSQEDRRLRIDELL